MTDLFRNRSEAGKLLAVELVKYANRKDVIVLGLPRGGVPVAFEVAKRLNAPLDVFVVRKLGVPGHRELAMGAIATGGVRILNKRVVEELGISEETIDAVAAEEHQELKRREVAYRGHGASPEIRGKTVILVDDGIATGSTMRAAVLALRKQHPAHLIVAVPTAAASSCHELRPQVDELVALMVPEEFYAVGQWYEDFSQTSDAEVTRLLEQAGRRRGGTATRVPSPAPRPMISDRREHYYHEAGVVLQGFGSTTPVIFVQAAKPLTAAKPDPIMREQGRSL